MAASTHTPAAAGDRRNHGKRLIVAWIVLSVVATPIVASVFALAANASANPAGNLYSHTSTLNDISSGSNGACGAPLCVAGQGWNGPTGLGTPEGTGAF